MKAFSVFQRVVDAILRWVCIVLFALLVILVVYQVVIRSFGGGNAWTEAMAVAIDFLVRKFPAAVVKFFEVLAHSIVGFFAVWVMIMGGWRLADSAFDQTVELLPFSQGQIYLILPVTGILIAIYCILNIIKAVTSEVKIVAEEDIDLASIQEEGI